MHYGAITHFPGDWNHLVDLVRHNAQEKSDMVMIINNRSTRRSNGSLAASNKEGLINSVLCLPREVYAGFGGRKAVVAKDADLPGCGPESESIRLALNNK